MALVGKSGHIGDFGNRDLAVDQQLFGEVQAQVDQVAMRRHAERFGEP